MIGSQSHLLHPCTVPATAVSASCLQRVPSRRRAQWCGGSRSGRAWVRPCRGRSAESAAFASAPARTSAPAGRGAKEGAVSGG